MARFRWLLLICGCSLLFFGCDPLASKAKSGLQVETGDNPSSLFLDGQYLDKTPFINKEIKPGIYTLKIQPENAELVPTDLQINLRQGLLTVVTWLPGKRPELSGGVTYEMEKLDNNQKTELNFVTIPDAAIVKITGRDKQFAPLTITDLPAGEQDFEVSLPSYDSQKHTVNLVSGYRTTITVKLAKSQSSLDTETQTSSSSALPTTTDVMASQSAAISATPSAGLAATATKALIKKTGYSKDGVEGLKVRNGAGSDNPEIGFIPSGTTVTYLKQALDGWYKVDFETLEGWINSQYVTLKP